MRIPPLAVGLVVVVTLLLSGCLPLEPTVGPTPQPSSTPVFASEEEALAAAEAAYARYLEVSDAILQDGGENPDRLEVVATAEVVDAEKAGFEDFRREGYRSVGSTKFESMVLQAYESSAQFGGEVIRVYVCTDVSMVDVIDSTGASIVSEGRPSRTAFEIGFDLVETKVLLLSSKDVWTGDGVC